MSFSYTIDLDNGIEVTYWELYSGTVNRIEKSVSWQLGGWISQAARNAGKSPAIIYRFTKTGADYPFDPKGPFEAALISVLEGLSRQDPKFLPNP